MQRNETKPAPVHGKYKIEWLFNEFSEFKKKEQNIRTLLYDFLWHHWLNGHEFEQTPGDRVGQGSLTFCSPWGSKESDTTEWLNNKMPEIY